MKAHFCFRLFAHAFVLQLALLLLASMAPLCAQPVLQEWWRAPNAMVVGGETAYLPNFYMGKSAMAIMFNERGATWLNRFPGDTLDIFSWKTGLPILTGDFNGDGLTDYLDGSGYLYKGIKGDFAAEKEPSGRIFEGRPQTITVCDANHDGKDDILFSIGSDIGYCRGRDNFAEITRKVLTPPAVVKQGESRGTGTFYLGSDGDLRHIVDMSRQLGSGSSLDSRDELEIYRYTWQAGDSVPKEIRKTGIIPGRKDRYMYSGYILVKPGSPGTDPDLYIDTYSKIFQVWTIKKDEPQYLREFNKVGAGGLQFLTSKNPNASSRTRRPAQ
jgi:hypothetical protein